MKKIALLLALLFMAGCGASNGGCRSDPPPPTATFPAPPTIAPTATATATVTASPTNQATATRPAASATPTPDFATATPTAPISTATPAVMGHHVVVYGETMYGIGLWWYRGQYLATGADVWTGICAANRHIENCRLIYPNDILAIPRRP